MSGTNGFGLWVNYVKCLWRSESKSSTFPCGCIDFANNSLNILFLLDTGSKSIRLFDVSLSGEVLQTKHNSHKLCTCIVKRLPIVVTVSRRRLWSPGILRDYIRALWLKCQKRRYRRYRSSISLLGVKRSLIRHKVVDVFA